MLLVCFSSFSNAEVSGTVAAGNDPAEIPVDLAVDWYDSTDPSVPSSQPSTEQPKEQEVETHYRTPNLIDNSNWDGATYGADPGGCCASISGSGALYDTTTDTIMFSYGMDTIQQVIAINQVFANTGISVDGYTYDMMFKRIQNNGGRVDNLYVDIIIKDASGNEVEQKTYDLSGLPNSQWEEFHAMQLFQNHYIDPQNATVRIRGKDGGFWAGYYGPEVKDVDFRLIYRSNPCAADPLYDPSCNGYAEAYAEQQYNQNCTANPLYDSGCPGYSTAFYNQQCSIDALYDAGCPGYADAYFNQQCTLDPLYDTGCSGYAVAYFDQQCSLDTFYDSQCPGYDEAYYNKYVKPGLDKQVEEAAGTSTDTIEEVATVDSLTNVSTTGDATVDEILRDNVAEIVVVDVAPIEPVIEVEIEPQEQEESVEEIELAEMEMEDELSESSSDVDESVGEDQSNDESPERGDEGDSDQASDEAGGESESGESDSEKKESKRDKMKKAVAKRASQLAENMSQAATLEAQQAVQQQVLALINYVPGFNQYGTIMPGGEYPGGELYQPTQLPESRRGLRNGLAQQLLHEEMVDMQYEGMRE